MTKELTVRDLVLARLDALEFESKHEDLASYYVARYAAMAAAFGVDHDRRTRDGTLSRLTESCIQVHREVHSPFSIYLEAPSEIIDLHRVHGKSIRDAVAETRKAIVDLLVDVTCRQFDLLSDRIVPLAALAEHGFDVEAFAPDPDDYW
jgi:hypothetical protein